MKGRILHFRELFMQRVDGRFRDKHLQDGDVLIWDATFRTEDEVLDFDLYEDDPLPWLDVFFILQRPYGDKGEVTSAWCQARITMDHAFFDSDYLRNWVDGIWTNLVTDSTAFMLGDIADGDHRWWWEDPPQDPL